MERNVCDNSAPSITQEQDLKVQINHQERHLMQANNNQICDINQIRSYSQINHLNQNQTILGSNGFISYSGKSPNMKDIPVAHDRVKNDKQLIVSSHWCMNQYQNQSDLSINSRGIKGSNQGNHSDYNANLDNFYNEIDNINLRIPLGYNADDLVYGNVSGENQVNTMNKNYLTRKEGNCNSFLVNGFLYEEYQEESNQEENKKEKRINDSNSISITSSHFFCQINKASPSKEATKGPLIVSSNKETNIKGPQNLSELFQKIDKDKQKTKSINTMKKQPLPREVGHPGQTTKIPPFTPFYCVYHRKDYHSKENYIHHWKSSPHFVCSTCGKNYINAKLLNEHKCNSINNEHIKAGKKSKSKGVSKSNLCQARKECEKDRRLISDNNTIKSHLLADNNLICPYCDIKCSNKVEFKKHSIEHYYYCDQCSKGFEFEDRWNQHYASSHSVNSQYSNKKPKEQYSKGKQSVITKTKNNSAINNPISGSSSFEIPKKPKRSYYCYVHKKNFVDQRAYYNHVKAKNCKKIQKGKDEVCNVKKND